MLSLSARTSGIARAILRVIITLLVAIIAGSFTAIAISRVYVLSAEVFYRSFPESTFALWMHYLWFDPGVRGDVLMVTLLVFVAHSVGYPLVCGRRSLTFHGIYFMLVGLGALVIGFSAGLVLGVLEPLHSPL